MGSLLSGRRETTTTTTTTTTAPTTTITTTTTIKEIPVSSTIVGEKSIPSVYYNSSIHVDSTKTSVTTANHATNGLDTTLLPDADPQGLGNNIIIIASAASLLLLTFVAVVIIMCIRNGRKKDRDLHASSELKGNEIYEMDGSGKQSSDVTRLNENDRTCSETKCDANSANATATDSTYTFAQADVQTSGSVLKENILYGTR